MSDEAGCLCGKMLYRINRTPLEVAVRHCRNCPKQSGAAFSVNVVVKATQVDLSGQLATFSDQSNKSRDVRRRFGPACGSPIPSELGSSPGVVAIKAGTLDETNDLQPRAQVWTSSKQAWLHLDGLQAFETDMQRA